MHIGIDTSCYTTSVAAVDGGGIIFDKRIMLDVADGEKGLRQSDAVFLHTRNLVQIFSDIDISDAETVSVSSRPRNIEGSYMPVFLAGICAAKAIKASLNCAYREFSHQQGHIMAGLYGADVLHWRGEPFLSFHLSGGTTEMLLIDGENIKIIGKTLDISAGQLIDRVGVAMGLKFPSGKELERLAAGKTEDFTLPVSVKGLDINFSGAESKSRQLKCSPENAAAAVLNCVAETVGRVIDNACGKYNVYRVAIVGGVGANRQIREYIGERAVFADPALCSDNAVGIAFLGGAV